MPERLRSFELDPQLSRAFAETFIPRWDCYALQLPDGTYVQKREPLVLQHITKHLTYGRSGFKPFTLGAYALDEESQARWVCFDADALLQWEQLRNLASTLRTQDVPSYLETSRRGGHLWLFIPLLSGKLTRQFAQALLDSANIQQFDNENKRSIEIYPKQDALGEGAGSFVRLPFGIHLKTGQSYHFIDHDGRPLAPTVREQLEILGSPQRVSQEFIRQFLPKPKEIQIFPPIPITPEFKRYHPLHNEPLSEALKNAISVFEFVGRFVSLDDQGRGLCPFHDDHKKSFGVHKDRNYWNCYAGCGGGSIIDFWIKWREASGQDSGFISTVKELRGMLLS